MNLAILIGNVGAEPESKTFGERKVVNFPLATSRKWNDKNGEKQEKTQWHRITVWGKQADVVEKYVKKGDKLQVQGEINYSEKDGKYYTDVLLERFEFLNSAKKEQEPKEEPKASNDDEADIPF